MGSFMRKNGRDKKLRKCYPFSLRGMDTIQLKMQFEGQQLRLDAQRWWLIYFLKELPWSILGYFFIDGE